MALTLYPVLVCSPFITPSPVPPSLGEQLQAATEALASARTQEDVCGVVLISALQAVAATILLVDDAGQRLDIVAQQGDGQGVKTLWQDGPLHDNVPAGDALERQEALFFEQEGDFLRAYPELEARMGSVAAGVTAVLPMFLDIRPLGVILLDFSGPHHFTPEETRFLRTLAAQCAIALGRARVTGQLEMQVRDRTAELEAIPDAVNVGSAQGITRANPRALEMLGFAHVEELNRQQLQNRHPDTLERVKPHEEAFAIALGGTPHTSDVLTRHLQTAEDRLIRSAAAPVRWTGRRWVPWP